MLEEVLATDENCHQFLLKTIESVRRGNPSKSVWGTSGTFTNFTLKQFYLF